ncbi:MAG TPA: hypothetical protein DCM08_09830 [Microscillaceae bacterium]|jgi:hypothetical protein|nr:hypothetical protein [Microscillaceae bacterium]
MKPLKLLCLLSCSFLLAACLTSSNNQPKDLAVNDTKSLITGVTSPSYLGGHTFKVANVYRLYYNSTLINLFIANQGDTRYKTIDKPDMHKLVNFCFSVKDEYADKLKHLKQKIGSKRAYYENITVSDYEVCLNGNYITVQELIKNEFGDLGFFVTLSDLKMSGELRY